MRGDVPGFSGLINYLDRVVGRPSNLQGCS